MMETVSLSLRKMGAPVEAYRANASTKMIHKYYVVAHAQMTSREKC